MNYKMNKIFLLFLIFGINICNSYKFLVVFPYPVRSLNILGEGFVNHLIDAGHEVTYISVFPLKNMKSRNFTQIDISDNLKIFQSSHFTISSVLNNELPAKDLHLLRQFCIDSAAATFSNNAVKKLFEDKTQTFDAVIADFYEIDVFAGIAALFDCPMIWSYSMGVHFGSLRLVDEPTNPAYVADYMSSNVPPLSFLQRMEELWSCVQWFYIKIFYLHLEENLYNSVFETLFLNRGKSIPQYKDIVYNASLILANDHFAIGNIPKLPANYKFIGGQHIAYWKQILPENLQALMDSAKHGVIYFSMGSTWLSKDIPVPIKKGLLQMFGELKQTVIWKYEEDLDDLPDNVHIIKWAPQTSILDHPNCKLFISHGGMLSSLEAIHYGVPVLGVPVYLDQFVNINKAVSHGYALKADLNYNLPANMKIAINKMLKDVRYAQRAKELSMIYHDRPASPGAELVHWVEHVVRTRGAPHLRSPALHVPWYQKMYLDLAACILVIIMMMKYFITSLLKSFSKKKPVQKNKKTK